MADVFQEVDNMMKQERIAKFWNDYGLFVIAFVVLTILGTAAYSGYSAWNNGVKERQTTELLAMFDAKDFPQGLEENAKSLRPALRAIAWLGAAQSEQDAGRNDTALKFYELAAGDNKIPAEFRDLAALMRAKMSTTLGTEEKLSALENIFNNTKSPWQYHALLEAALIEAHNKNDYAAARVYLERIIKAQPEALPQSLIGKAQSLDHIYAIKQKETVSGKTGSAPQATPAADTQTPANDANDSSEEKTDKKGS